MNPSTEFRTPDQEVEKLLEECHTLRSTLKEISSQISRMENRVKRAFPAAAMKANHSRQRAANTANVAESSLTPEQSIREFETAVQLAKENPASAESYLLDKTTGDLIAIAREIGIPIRKNKPSRKAIQAALYGKIRESILLSRHNNLRNPAA